MSHRHLMLAYAATWVIQLGYVAFLAGKWLALRQAEREFPTYQDNGE